MRQRQKWRWRGRVQPGEQDGWRWAGSADSRSVHCSGQRKDRGCTYTEQVIKWATAKAKLYAAETPRKQWYISCAIRDEKNMI